MGTYLFYKRIFDFLISLVMFITILPFFLVLIIIIKVDSEGPIFFKQKRIGLNKKDFYILKFRTMSIDTPRDMPTHLLKNPEAYITNVGKFLRKSSLDELPQIINILKGEMSFVGPRPALWNQYDLIAERDIHGANNIYPGLTGWAQVNGRDELIIETKAKLDGEYVKRISFLLDSKIIIMTISQVFSGKGIIEGAINRKADSGSQG